MKTGEVSIMYEKTMKRVLVRLPEDVYEFLAEEAQKNCASRNSEVVRSVRARMDAERQGKAVG
jgi:metal-responsive CopG/Arc/MetJ family transcriptional regulator